MQDDLGGVPVDALVSRFNEPSRLTEGFKLLRAPGEISTELPDEHQSIVCDVARKEWAAYYAENRRWKRQFAKTA